MCSKYMFIVDTTNNQCVLNHVYVDNNNQCVLNNVYVDTTNNQCVLNTWLCWYQ